MAASTAKKVLIRRFDREPLTGFVNTHGYLQPGGVELEPGGDSFGRALRRDQSRLFCERFRLFRRARAQDFQHSSEDERAVGSDAASRRRGDGRDPVERPAAACSGGFTLVPPDTSSNNQKLFIPRAALTQMHVLGVVGSPLTRRKKKPPVPKEQIGLFE